MNALQAGVFHMNRKSNEFELKNHHCGDLDKTFIENLKSVIVPLYV